MNAILTEIVDKDWTDDAFMDGYAQGNPDVTYDRLRAMAITGC